MRDLNDRRAFVVQASEERHDLFALSRVEIAGGLVGQDQPGVGDDGARDRHELLLSPRELVGIEVFLADNLKAIQDVRHNGFALVSPDVPIGKWDV